MDLNTLKLFVAAAEAGSLSEAARRQGIPLPTLSRRIRRLEDDLGLRLLDRGPRGLALTAAGTQLRTDVAPALATLAQAGQRLHDASGMAGTLRVSLPPHFSPMWPVLAEFRRRHPAVRLDVFVTDRRVDLVEDGIDLVIRVGAGGNLSYVGRTVVRYRHQVVARPSLLKRLEVARPEDLRDVACACWRTVGPSSWTLGDVEVRLNPVLVTNDYEHLLQTALAGEVITELPPFVARGSLKRGRLVEVLPDHPLPLLSVRALVVETRALSPLLRRFLDFVVAELSDSLGGVADD